jgi:hypothetical protein
LPYEHISQKVADFQGQTHHALPEPRRSDCARKFEKFKKELAEDSEVLQHFMALLANNSPIKRGSSKSWLMAKT